MYNFRRIDGFVKRLFSSSQRFVKQFYFLVAGLVIEPSTFKTTIYVLFIELCSN